MKKWVIAHPSGKEKHTLNKKTILSILLSNRGVKTKKEEDTFLHPKNPIDVSADDVHIDKKELEKSLKRIVKAIEDKESIVVYADYDADGVTAGSIMWEALHSLGANVMPYVPHRVDEGYGFSIKGFDYIIETYHPTLVISVDHGVTAFEQISYAQKKGIDVIVTDHHVKPSKLPECPMVHTTELSGAGVSWFVMKEVCKKRALPKRELSYDHKTLLEDLLALATIGTIADMVPLVNGNRSIAKYGLLSLRQTKRKGLVALMKEAGIDQTTITSYTISHIIAPRINAMGRLEHAMDSIRLLCTTNEARAQELAKKLGSTNKDRQQMTVDTTLHAKDIIAKSYTEILATKVMIVSHESYNQGIIGLVAGKIVETYYRPSIVIAKGESISKASARSIPGFNIVEAIRSLEDILIDVGGHPMAAGFTLLTENIPTFVERFEKVAEHSITDELLARTIYIDMEIPLSVIDISLWEALLPLEPFGFGNYQPVFVSRNVTVKDVRVIGNGNKHLKLKVEDNTSKTVLEAIAFGKGDMGNELKIGQQIDVVYSIDLNEWNGIKKMQLVVKDIESSG